MPTVPNIFWDVLTGILTTAVLFGAGLFFKKVFLPWYQAIRFQGVDLAGTWFQEYDHNGAHYRIQTSLTQAAHELSGTTTLIKSGSGDKDYMITFTVKGTTWEGFVMLNLQSTDRRILSFATALLKIHERGGRLGGVIAFRSASSDEVQSEAANWGRMR